MLIDEVWKINPTNIATATRIFDAYLLYLRIINEYSINVQAPNICIQFECHPKQYEKKKSDFKYCRG